MKIIVVEDHALVRDLLIKACREAVAGASVLGAKDAASGLTLCHAEKPDLVLLDLALPDRDGLELVGELGELRPRCKVIGLSGYSDEVTLHRVLNSKLDGFVDKNEQPLDTLSEAIKTVMGGGRYFSPVAQRARLSLRNDPIAFAKVFSEREQTLLGLLGCGLSNEKIGEELSLSANTVRNHRSRIMAKLGFHTSQDLMRYALEKGFIRQHHGRMRLVSQ